MQSHHQRLTVYIGCAFVGALLALNAYVTWRQLNAQVDIGVWVLHTQQVRLELAQTEGLLVNAETGERGYLLTGDERYLAPYQLAKEQIVGHVENLATLTADNPAQQKSIAALRPLTLRKLDELDRMIKLQRAGEADAAKDLVLSSQGLQTMESLHLILGEMRREEMRLDKVRSDAYQNDVRATAASIWLATLVGMMGLAGFCWLVVRLMQHRERHARELGEREEWFRTTLSSIGDAVIATDRTGRVVFLNPVAEALTGLKLDEALGKSIAQVFPIFNELTGLPAPDPVSRVVGSGVVVGLANHTVLMRRDGATIPIEDSAAPISDDRGDLVGVVLVFRDVTADRNAQEVLRKAEKLAAAARLSATMAHEINNPLAAVMNLLYLARSEPGTSEAVAQKVMQAEDELERVAHITRKTLGFYRESGTSERVEIPQLVESVLKLYQNNLSAKSVTLRREFEQCPPAEGVLGELRQAVSNLVANAIDAVGERGTITVGVRALPGKPNTVEITVSDDGPGIAGDQIHRIFEPFFTTKKDVGTGLGLWSAKSIVERHGGYISLSANGHSGGARGATFTIHLPCAAHQEAAEIP